MVLELDCWKSFCRVQQQVTRLLFRRRESGVQPRSGEVGVGYGCHIVRQNLHGFIGFKWMRLRGNWIKVHIRNDESVDESVPDCGRAMKDIDQFAR